MATQLFQFDSYPNDIAITQTEFVPDGLFFLDFSRPLKYLRWFGITNERFGFTVGLFVPVVHQNEEKGGFVVGVHRSDPYFTNILELWKKRYPSTRSRPMGVTDPLSTAAGFGQPFPANSQLPPSGSSES